MAYNLDIEKQIEKAVQPWKNLQKKSMFGGVCYLINGNMAFGIWKEFLVVRAGDEAAAPLLKAKKVLPFAATGKPMKGWFMVTADQCQDNMGYWLDFGKTLALSLPAKKK